MLQNFIVILRKITNWKIIALFVVAFFVILAFPWQFIPDYLKLGDSPGKRDLIFRLLGTTIGFSGIMLTLLLVGYNFYVKTTRRFTLEFITDNRWLKFIFSSFFGMVIFLGLGFLFVETSYFNDTTFLYCAFLLTIFFILSLFPLSILALNDSVSLERIHKIIGRITEADVDHLYTWPQDEKQPFEQIEKHPILILKDLCITAINDKDWILPQTVLNALHKLLISRLHKESTAYDVQKSTYVWAFFSNHLKKEVVKQNDHVTAHVLLSLTLRTYDHFAENKIVHIRSNKIDEFLKDYLRLIIEQNSFGETQSYFSAYITTLLKAQFKSIKYTDEELITEEYRYENFDKQLEYKHNAATNLWFYLTKELPDILFDTIACAIDNRRKAVYECAFDNIQHLMEAIFLSDNLTKYQKRSAIKELMFKGENISENAIKRGIYDRIVHVSHLQIEEWVVKDQYLGYPAFSGFKRIIKKLAAKNELSEMYIDDLFMIGRALSRKPIEASVLNNIVEEILKIALPMLESEKTEMQTKRAILYELNWFQSVFLNVNDLLLPTKEKYNNRITDLLTHYKEEIPLYW